MSGRPKLVYPEQLERLQAEIGRLLAALEKIRDTAYSPQGDDWIWMDDQTPLGQFIDSVINRVSEQ